MALIAKGEKKSKKGPKGGGKQQGDQKKDLSKVKCFACQKFGHYDGQCPNKKKKKKTAASKEVDDYAVKLEREFSLFVGHSFRAPITSI